MKKVTSFLKRVCACALSVALGLGMAPTDMMAQAATTETGNEVVLRFAVASDMHLFNSINGVKNETMFKGMFTSAYAYAATQTYDKLDAVVLVGDIVDRGKTEEYEALKKVFDDITVKEETEILTVMGNHEWWASNNDGYPVSGDKAYSDGVNAIDKIDTKTEDWSVDINGYKFIAMSPLSNDTYGETKISWMSAQLQTAAAADTNEDSKKPIFTFQHHPITGTVYSSDTVTSMTEDSNKLNDIYGNYSQVINFSGHLHVPVNTPTSICQKNGYTQVSTGSMYSIDSLEKASAYGSLPPNSTNTGQYTIVEVYEDNTVKLLPYDQYRNGFYNTPQVGSETQLVYTVDVNDTENWLYTDAKKETEAPAFPAGTIVSTGNTTYKSAEVSFAQATDNVGVYAYDITCTSKDDATANTWRVFSEWYFGKDMPATIKYNMTGLKANTSYDVSVTPVDFYGNKGTAITGTVTTAQMSENDYLKLTFQTISDGAWYFNVNNQELFADQYYKTPVVIDGEEGHVIMSVQSNGSVCIWSNFFNLCGDAGTPAETFKIPAGAVLQAVKSSSWSTPIEKGDTITVGETLYLKKMGDSWVVGKELEGGNGTFDSADGMNADGWYIGTTQIGKVEKVQATEQVDVITNGDFEDATFNNGNWNMNKANGAPEMGITTDPDDATNHVLKLERDTSATGTLSTSYTSSSVLFEAGKTYTVTVKVKSEGDVKYRLYYDNVGCPSNWQINGTDYSGTTKWTTYTYQFTPTEGKTWPQIGFQLISGTGTVYLDDLTVTYGIPKTEKTPHEVVVNGDFEDTTFNNWNWQMSQIKMSVTTDPADATNKVLKLVRDASETGVLATYYTNETAIFEAGKTYNVTVKVKSEGNVKYRLYYDNVGCTSNWQINRTDYSNTTEWTTYTYQFTPEKATTWPQIGFQLMSGAGTVYLDDLSVAWHEETPVYEYPTDGLVEFDGNWALRMGSGEKKVTYDITDMSAGIYEYSFKVKNESTTETAKFQFCGETIEVAPGSQWVKKTGLLTSTEAIKELTFQRISGAFYLDDVELYEHMHNYDQKKVDAQYLKSAATCTKAAVYCKSCECGAKGTETFTSGKAKGHNYKTTVTKATTSKNGKIVKQCSRCKANSEKTIYKASKVSLKTEVLSYTGKAQKPALIVKDSKGNTIDKKYYDVTWAKGRKNVGTYTVKVKFKGNYSGTKTLTFKINPAKVSIQKVTAAKKGFTVKLAKQKTSLVNGYQVQYSTSKSFKRYTTKTITNKGKTISYKVSKLTGNKKYYVRVRAYKKVDGKKYYSTWSAVKNVTTKK